ncbi:YihY/virulence factor BrkB family protein [Pararhodonellum marinum]|uniref:YihY/virulence factor BrkB family protein n=1 Tax=Pararhodonellum marinum TaxID=2755358 RepID=UPI00188F32FA|nr:YihY/virulence factor BrkB family protein [Pararhodonellum marinum]
MISHFFKTTWEVIKKSLSSLREQEPVVYCAAIAFFTIFSLPAILLVVILVGRLFFDGETVKEEIVIKFREYVDAEAGEQVGKVIDNIIELPTGFIYMFLLALIVIKSATMIFFIMQKALNSIWKVSVKKKVNFFKLLKYRSATLILVVGMGFILVLSLLLDLTIGYVRGHLDILPNFLEGTLITGVSLLFNVLVVFVFFTFIHKYLPDVLITWRDAIAGGMITTLLFVIGKEVIAIILNNAKIEGYYAAAGSLVILLLWIFYSSIIFFIGGVFTRSYSRHRGHVAEPKPIAYLYEKEERGN